MKKPTFVEMEGHNEFFMANVAPGREIRATYTSGDPVIHQKVNAQLPDHLRPMAIFKYNVRKKQCCCGIAN